MDSGFKDPIKIKNKSQAKRSPWNFDAPAYDERSSSFINAGTNYGSANRQPVGHTGNPSTRAATLPFGRVNTMKVDEK